MTCVAAIVKNGTVYMAADSLGSNGFTGTKYKNKKIVRKGDFLFGNSGSYKAINILQEDFTPPKRMIGEERTAYVFRVSKEISKNLVKDKFCSKDKDGQKQLDCSVLIGYEGSIYVLQGDGAVLETYNNYDSIGSGTYHAEASLFSTEGTELSPEDRLRKAIICANNFVLSVDDSIQFEVLQCQ